MSSPNKDKAPSAPNKAFVRKDPERWKKAGWTSVPNSIIRDEDLPPIEAWAWMWLASHTEAFEVSGDALWRANNHLGRDKAYALLRALEQRGLLLRSYHVGDAGVPYMLYDLQPTPVPPEQRTAKPGKAKATKKRPFPAKQQVTTDSWTVRNPGTTRDPDPADKPGSTDDTGGSLLNGQESGHDQGVPHDEAAGAGLSTGGVSPDGAVPDPSGESYKEENTKPKDQPSTPSLRSGVLGKDHSPSIHQPEVQTARDDTATNLAAAPEPAGSRNDGWMEHGTAREEPHNAAQERHTQPHTPTADITTGCPHKSCDKGSEDGERAGSVILGKLERQIGQRLNGRRDKYVALIEDARTVMGEESILATLGDGLASAATPAGALVQRIRRDLTAATAARQAELDRHARKRQQAAAAASQRRADRDATVASEETRQAARASVRLASGSGSRTGAQRGRTRRVGQRPGLRATDAA